MLIFHGNAGNISHRLDYLQMFHKLGYATLIIDYRGYGKSTGSPSEAGHVPRRRSGVALARRRPRHQGGRHRADGRIARRRRRGVARARRVTPRAVILASTFTSVPDLGAQVYPFLPVRLVSRFSYDSMAAVKAIRSPLLIAHSREDDIVPYSHGRALFEAANEPKAVPGDEGRAQRRLPVRAAGVGRAARGVSRTRRGQERRLAAKAP